LESLDYNLSMNFIRVQLIYPEDKVKEPLLCALCKNFDVVVNIRTAKVSKDTGILTVEIDGEAEEIDRAIKFLEEKGVIVQPIEGQIFTE
jgi:ABC-type methionine transport system ATPase subunit